MSGGKDIAFYYGKDKLTLLAGYRRVVLQGAHYDASELAWLRTRGVSPLAYLSLSEDPGPPAPWQVGQHNPEWGTSYVDVAHPDWVKNRLAEAEGCLARGFAGLFLDTLDIADLYLAARPAMLELLSTVRMSFPSAYLLANRGFSLLPDLGNTVDGLVFEAFSTAWQHGNAPCHVLSPEELEVNSRLAHQLRNYNLDLFALDYADSAVLAAFARTRAALHGFGWFTSDRFLTTLPDA